VTHDERLALFRPHVQLQLLETQESLLVNAAMRLMARQAESLRISISRGTKPSALILDRGIVADLAKLIAASLIQTTAFSRWAVNTEIDQARLKETPATFAVEKLPEPDAQGFYPQGGLDWYQNYALRLAGVQQTDALEAAKAAVVKGIEEGLPHIEVMGLLGNTFETFSKNRLEMIARTETAKIYEQARWQEFESLDEIVGYEISAILDSRVCPICRARDGKIIRKSQADGKWPPYHPQCRCCCLGIFSWEIEDGSVKWKPIPKSAPAVAPGFGTTSMEIPDPQDKAARKLIVKAGGKLPKPVKPAQ
jgi:SPP1 gp7 family putative phage head morphogenesis protein